MSRKENPKDKLLLKVIKLLELYIKLSTQTPNAHENVPYGSEKHKSYVESDDAVIKLLGCELLSMFGADIQDQFNAEEVGQIEKLESEALKNNVIEHPYSGDVIKLLASGFVPDTEWLHTSQQLRCLLLRFAITGLVASLGMKDVHDDLLSFIPNNVVDKVRDKVAYEWSKVS